MCITKNIKLESQGGHFTLDLMTIDKESNLWFGLVGFYGISTLVGYLMPNPLYTHVLNIYDLVWFGFMAYQL